MIQTLDRMQYFTILQYKLHSFSIQDDRSTRGLLAKMLRAHDCKYRESLAKLKKSKILIICQKNPLGELSSKKIFSTFKNL